MRIAQVHYASLADSAVAALSNKDYSSIQEVEVDISNVCNQLVNAALSSIPPSKHPKRHPNKVFDPHLSTLCWQSRVAFRQWKAAGSPRSGPLYDERKNCKKNVREYLSKRRAQLQRRVTQKRDQAFHLHHPKHFKMTFRKSGGSTLLVNGSPTSDRSTVLPAWVDHFSKLGTSQISANTTLQKISHSIPNVELATLTEQEMTCPFCQKKLTPQSSASNETAQQAPTPSPHSTLSMLARSSNPGSATLLMPLLTSRLSPLILKRVS